MQVLWREAFDGNRLLTVDEFLYCYKPLEISQSLGFYQFSTWVSSCRFIRSPSLPNRRSKTKFFFISGFWAGNPIEVGRDSFPHYIGEIFIAVTWPSLSKFLLDSIQQARFFVDRTFHFLVTLYHLSSWELRPKPTEEVLAHELTTHRHELLISPCFGWLIHLDSNKSFFFVGMAKNEGKQRKWCGWWQGYWLNSSSYFIHNETRPSNLIRKEEDSVQEIGHR